MELTVKQFVEELERLNGEGKTFNVESKDTGNITFSLHECSVSFHMEDGISGELVIFKPDTSIIEVAMDFDIINDICKDEESYFIAFANGISDIEISIAP